MKKPKGGITFNTPESWTKQQEDQAIKEMGGIDKKTNEDKIIYDNEGEISLFDVFAKNKVRLPLVVMEMISNKIVGNENVKYDWFVPNNEIEFHRIKIKVEKLAQGYSAYIDYEETLVLGVGLTIKEAVDDVKKAFAVMKEERDYVFDETFNVLISAEDL